MISDTLSVRCRDAFQLPVQYGRLWGEGSYVMAHTNHRWPRHATLQDAIRSQSVHRFAHAESCTLRRRANLA